MNETPLKTIVSEDGHVTLSLTPGDIRLQRSPALRAEARRELSGARASLPGGLIGRFARWAIELRHLCGASAQGGHVRLLYDHFQVNGRPALETFAAGPARDFAAALNRPLAPAL